MQSFRHVLATDYLRSDTVYFAGVRVVTLLSKGNLPLRRITKELDAAGCVSRTDHAYYDREGRVVFVEKSKALCPATVPRDTVFLSFRCERFKYDDAGHLKVHLYQATPEIMYQEFYTQDEKGARTVQRKRIWDEKVFWQ